jgi:hypothetical protein
MRRFSLTFAKLEAGKPQVTESDFYPVSLDAVQENLTGTARKKGLELKDSVAEELSGKLIVGDPVLTKRTLLKEVKLDLST